MNPKASIDEASERFQKHLDEENNFRIIFSGKYGIGKTYFLREFFDERPERYNKFIISPVNYVVSSNEDIFELIKVDIIMQLFEKGMIKQENKRKVSKLNKIEWLAAEKPLHILKFFSTAVKKIKAGPFEIETEFFKALIEIKEEYDKYTEDFEERMETDKETFEKFLNSFSESTGNIYESNFLTQLINNKLEAARTITDSDNKKENILIIDDLDRIDPEHIFRIFNILSAHNNFFGEKNKFAFDKIILVCDIDNIQKIFEHKYGQKVDFTGYIDKFYSTKIFKYDNTDAIGIFVHDLNLALAPNDQILLKYLLVTFINKGLLTMRQLIKYNHKSPLENNVVKEYRYSQNNQQHSTAYRNMVSFIVEGTLLQLKVNDISFLKIINTCIILFGGYNGFINAIKSLKENQVTQFSVESENHLDAISESLVFPFHISSKLFSAEFEIFYKIHDPGNINNAIFTVNPTMRMGKYDYTFKTMWAIDGNRYGNNENPLDYFANLRIEKRHYDGNNGFDAIDKIYQIVNNFHSKKILYRAKITTD